MLKLFWFSCLFLIANAIPEGYRIVEGDILEPVHQIQKRNAITNPRRLWKNATVPYELAEGHYTAGQQLRIVNMLNYLSLMTCVEFRPRNESDVNYLLYFNGDGCYSEVGCKGGRQEISVGEFCLSEHTVAHESIHALGFYHEHNRLDRDFFVNIHWENMAKEIQRQFYRQENGRTFKEFDFDSTMLYGPYTFSNNKKPTITSKVPGKRVLSDRQKPPFSKGDIDMINELYGCYDPENDE